MFNSATGQITASTSVSSPDELIYLSRIGEKTYLHNLRSPLGGPARPQNALALTWSPTAISVAEADPDALPKAAFLAPDGATTVCVSDDNTILARYADGSEKILLATGHDPRTGNLTTYAAPGHFVDDTCMLYRAHGEWLIHYGLVDLATGALTQLPALDGLEVVGTVDGVIYAREQTRDEMRVWSVTRAGAKTLCYAIPTGRTLDCRDGLWVEYDRASKTYTLYDLALSRTLAVYLADRPGPHLVGENRVWIIGGEDVALTETVSVLPAPTQPAQPTPTWPETLELALPALSSPTAYDPDDTARRLGQALPDGEVAFHARIFASQTYLYFVTLPAYPQTFLVYTHTPGAKTMTRLPLDLPDGDYDAVRPILVSGGGGSGECRIWVELTTDGRSTVVQLDNFAYTDGRNWLEFAYRGEVGYEELFSQACYDPGALHGYDLPLPTTGLMPPFTLDDRYLLYAEDWPSQPTAGHRPYQRFWLVDRTTDRVVAVTELETDRPLDRLTRVGEATCLWSSEGKAVALPVRRVHWSATALTIEQTDLTPPELALEAAVTVGYRMRETRTTLWLGRASTGTCLFAETDDAILPVPLALPHSVSYNESSFDLVYDDSTPGVVTLILTLRDGIFDGYTYRFFAYTNAHRPGSTDLVLSRELSMDEVWAMLETGSGRGVLRG